MFVFKRDSWWITRLMGILPHFLLLLVSTEMFLPADRLTYYSQNGEIEGFFSPESSGNNVVTEAWSRVVSVAWDVPNDVAERIIGFEVRYWKIADSANDPVHSTVKIFVSRTPHCILNHWKLRIGISWWFEACCRQDGARGIKRLKHKLLKSFAKEYKLVLLGATGVEKSPFFNAFVYYLNHETLEDATRDNMIPVIPTSCTVTQDG